MENIVDGKNVETITTYYDNGQIHRQWQQTDYVLHGFHKEYYESGAKKAIREYRNNEIFKIDFAWYENGQLKKELKKSESIYLLIEFDKVGSQISKYWKLLIQIQLTRSLYELVLFLYQRTYPELLSITHRQR